MKIKKLFNKYSFAWPILLLISCLAIYFKSTAFEFLINFDDDTLILNSPELNSFNWDNIRFILTNPKDGLYHPITSLSWLIENSLFGLDPFWFHLNNILFHMASALVLYAFIQKFFQNKNIALFALALFLIHPMHVENVAWISGRKDLVFGLFFLLSLNKYADYQLSNNKRDFIFAILFFIASLLSKINAAVLPAIFILMDYYKDESISKKSIIRQIPLFIVGAALVFYTIYLQKTAGFINEANPDYSFIDRFFMLTYSISYYLSHLIIPYPLSPKNLYPNLNEGLLAWHYYASIGFLIGIIILGLRSKFKNAFILSFVSFILVLLPVLKIIPTGNDLVSNRYVYMAYPFFYAFLGMVLFSTKKGITRTAALLIISVFAFVSYHYQDTYQNSISVWTAVIESTEGNNWGQAMAYNERGQVKLKNGLQGPALKDIESALRIKPDLRRALLNRANIYERNQKNEQAISDINKVLEMNDQDIDALKLRGVLYAKSGNTEKAIIDLNNALKIQPERADLLNNLGIAYSILEDTIQAMESYEKALSIDPYYYEVYVNRGNLFLQQKNFAAAEKDFQKVIKEYPQQQSTRYLLAKCYLEQEKDKEAKKQLDFIANNTLLAGQVGERLLSEGYPNLSIHYLSIAVGNEQIRDKSYYQRATAYKQIQEYQNAIDDLLVIIETLPGPQIFFEIANLYLELGEKNKACEFWKEAADRKHGPAAELLQKNC